jgi:hypothetical protein
MSVWSVVSDYRDELKAYDERAVAVMRALLQTPTATRLLLPELPMEFWLEVNRAPYRRRIMSLTRSQEISKHLVLDCKRSLGACSTPTPLHAFAGVPWKGETTGISVHTLKGNDGTVGFATHSSSDLELKTTKEHNMAALKDEMLDTGFEPRIYCKQWSKSMLDHWATIAIVPFSSALHPQEREYRMLLTQIISIFVQFWIGALPARVEQASKTAANNLCLQMYNTIPVSTCLDATSPTASTAARGLIAAKKLSIECYIDAYDTYHIHAADLSRIFSY